MIPKTVFWLLNKSGFAGTERPGSPCMVPDLIIREACITDTPNAMIMKYLIGEACKDIRSSPLKSSLFENFLEFCVGFGLDTKTLKVRLSKPVERFTDQKSPLYAFRRYAGGTHRVIPGAKKSHLAIPYHGTEFGSEGIRCLVRYFISGCDHPDKVGYCDPIFASVPLFDPITASIVEEKKKKKNWKKEKNRKKKAERVMIKDDKTGGHRNVMKEKLPLGESHLNKSFYVGQFPSQMPIFRRYLLWAQAKGKRVRLMSQLKAEYSKLYRDEHSFLSLFPPCTSFLDGGHDPFAEGIERFLRDTNLSFEYNDPKMRLNDWTRHRKYVGLQSSFARFNPDYIPWLRMMSPADREAVSCLPFSMLEIPTISVKDVRESMWNKGKDARQWGHTDKETVRFISKLRMDQVLPIQGVGRGGGKRTPDGFEINNYYD
jgi:hypothetical protein